jgi:hypothetical protein
MIAEYRSLSTCNTLQPPLAQTLAALLTTRWFDPCAPLLPQADVEAAVYLMMANEMVHKLHPDVSCQTACSCVSVTTGLLPQFCPVRHTYTCLRW